MFDLQTWLWALAAITLLLTAVWVASLKKRDASIIDPFWSLTFVVALFVYIWKSPAPDGARRWLLASLVLVWALRLAIYLFWRNWGKPEDRRYVAMRERQGANFPVVSLFTVFWVQAALAWVVSLPLLAGVDGSLPLHAYDWIGVALWTLGMSFQVVGDFQLARFKAAANNEGAVLDSGLWRYTRHPNYFGEFCIWWGFGCFALALGAWWALLGPAVMSVMLLQVSGVALLESDIADRRPGYREYVRRTSAFFPWPPRPAA